MAILASQARNQLDALVQQVNHDQLPVEIVSAATSAFLVPADQWRSLMETAQLVSSPANARNILASIAEAEAGRVVTHDLDDLMHPTDPQVDPRPDSSH